MIALETMRILMSDLAAEEAVADDLAGRAYDAEASGDARTATVLRGIARVQRVRALELQAQLAALGIVCAGRGED